MTLSGPEMRNGFITFCRIPSFSCFSHSFVPLFFAQLTSLTELRSNPDYAFLKELFASKNNLKTLEDLRGSPFLINNPTALDVHKNKITDVRR